MLLIAKARRLAWSSALRTIRNCWKMSKSLSRSAPMTPQWPREMKPSHFQKQHRKSNAHVSELLHNYPSQGSERTRLFTKRKLRKGESSNFSPFGQCKTPRMQETHWA